MSDNLMSQAAAWLLTYALHSTLFLGLAWLASKRLAGRRARLEEAMWRFALVGALVTATAQLAAGWEPVAGRWALDAPAAPTVEMARVERSIPVPMKAVPVARALPAPPAASSLPSWPFDLRSTVLGAWAVCPQLHILAMGLSSERLQSGLPSRPERV
jgi:hypothetical protein